MEESDLPVSIHTNPGKVGKPYNPERIGKKNFYKNLFKKNK